MTHESRVLDRDAFDRLLAHAATLGEVLGPTVQDGAIRYGPVAATEDLPLGWSDEQAPGRYRISHDPVSPRLFDYAVGPDSLKPLFHPAETPLFSAQRRDGRLTFVAHEPRVQPRVIVGARPCELAAVAVQDRVLAESPHPDRTYVERRADQIVIAVDCGAPAATCFCTSMGTGPGAIDGFDIAMTEVGEDDVVRYVCRAGSITGQEILDAIDAPVARPGDVANAENVVQTAADSMSIRLDPEDARDALAAATQSEVWTEIEERCLACGNCTLVCPTCFCTTTVDSTSLADGSWTRSRTWDSCFSLDFSALHGHPVRESIGSRYRQWITHKLSSWYDQFGSTGCVGCGRCTTWCPVGIDLVAEANKTTTGGSS